MLCKTNFASSAVTHVTASLTKEKKNGGNSALWQCRRLHLLWQHLLLYCKLHLLLHFKSLYSALLHIPADFILFFFPSEERTVLQNALGQECIYSLPPLQLISFFFNCISGHSNCKNKNILKIQAFRHANACADFASRLTNRVGFF